jgi:hypothetical protein
MNELRQFVAKKQEELKAERLQLENEKMTLKIDKIASNSHHLISTAAVSGVLGGRTIPNDQGLTEIIIRNSSGISSMKDFIQVKAKGAKKIVNMEEIPKEEASKLVQGPFLVENCSNSSSLNTRSKG